VKDHPDKDAFLTLCVRYLSGEATSSERKTLVDELNVPSQKEYFESLQATWNSVPRPPAPLFDADSAFARLKLSTPPVAKKPLATSRAKRRFRPAMWRRCAFAALAVSILCPLAYQFLDIGAPREEQWVERRNEKGERSAFAMTDGTRVTLNSDSVIWLASESSSAPRRVRLNGEALFEVTHNDKQPFIVETGQLRVTVLGTRFNVGCYEDGGPETISLLEGSLRVSHIDADGQVHETMLSPGEQYTFEEGSDTGTVGTFDADSIVAWTRDLMIFKEEHLDSVARKLERRFGIPVILDNPAIAQQTLTGRFDRESLDDILTVISFASGLNFEVVRNSGHISKIIISQD